MMSHQILEALSICHKKWSPLKLSSESALKKFEDFVLKYPTNSFERANTFGHFTGSALLTNSDFSKVLLTFHAKLNKWLQLGGHADGDHDLAAVAEREVCEESGLMRVDKLFWQKDSPLFLPFDFDVHAIPENKKDHHHYHFDVRYLFVTDEPEKIQISPESKDLKWFTLEEAEKVTSEESTLRQLRKFRHLVENNSLFK